MVDTVVYTQDYTDRATVNRLTRVHIQILNLGYNAFKAPTKPPSALGSLSSGLYAVQCVLV